ASLTAESSTNLADGFLKGCRALRTAALPPNQRARLVLLTDGLANTGVATSRAELRALVREHVGPFSLSAFGFGDDCDHSILAELSEEGGGSFAFIQSEDGVLTAFARELGGLVSTYAADVRVRIVPVAGAQSELRLGDLLYQAELPLCVAIAAPRHPAATNVEVARVHVSFRDATGHEREVTTPVLVDYVPRGEEDASMDPEVLRARDERLLREAQAAAEAHARDGDYAAARQALATAIALMQTPDLVAFARATLLPCYEDQRVYAAATGLRASADMALKKRRLLAADENVPVALAPPASPAEVQMEASFRDEE
ncbi:MAG TPA: hypothetical protein VKY73_02060, partial [Polyangiaceae bacterium]|nr:hypothetical protein [Polyangiaceae bacterium]